MIKKKSRTRALRVTLLGCVLLSFVDIVYKGSVILNETIAAKASLSTGVQQQPPLEKALAQYLTSSSTTAGKDSNIRNTGYMLRHAQSLRQQAQQLDSTLFLDLVAANSNTTTTSTRIPFRLHFFTYATDSMNLTLQRILYQARRSHFFETVTALGPQDLPADYASEFADILNDPHGGGNFLWRYPIWELIMQERVPLYDYVLFLDAGCTILSTGQDMLLRWLKRVKSASERSVLEKAEEGDTRKEMMRFPQEFSKNREARWSTDATFAAFGLEPDGPNAWPGSFKPQLYGGLLLVRNGPQWRTMTATIYEALDPDPYIITDKHSPATKKRRPGRFEEHRHDQSISSIASKVLDNFITSPSMDTGSWEKPPFGVSRFRNITANQLERWVDVCRDAPREEDVKCDGLSESIFDLNSEIE